MDVYVSQFIVFVLMFARIASLIVIAPILGHQAIPVQVKVALAIFLAFVLFPLQSSMTMKVDIKLIGIAVLVLQEIGVGLIIGFATGLIFAGIRYAGDLIGFDMGYSIASVYDPETNATVPVVGEVLYTFMALLFLLLNGHHFVLQALQLSYKAVPIGGLSITAIAAEKFVGITGLLLVVAVKFAAPVIVAMFLTNTALGILTRVIPQMNIFGVVFPLKIGVGVIVLMTSVPIMIYVFKKLLLLFETNVFDLVKAL